MTCLRKHTEPVAGCPSCERMAADSAYRQAVEMIPIGGGTVSRPASQPPAPKEPVGTELKALLTELGIDADLIKSACESCANYAGMLDRWGVKVCRARLNEIAGRLKDQAIAHKARFRDGPLRWAGVASRALKMGLVLNPTNPYPGLVQLAIDRAEAKAAAEPTKPAAGTPGPSPEGSPPSLG
jgi:hypothetical protein